MRKTKALGEILDGTEGDPRSAKPPCRSGMVHVLFEAKRMIRVHRQRR
jgi:hypothetical protein